MNSGNTAWVLVCAALVLFMTPGLALFYGGTVRTNYVLTRDPETAPILNQLDAVLRNIRAIALTWSTFQTCGRPQAGASDWESSYKGSVGLGDVVAVAPRPQLIGRSLEHSEKIEDALSFLGDIAEKLGARCGDDFIAHDGTRWVAINDATHSLHRAISVLQDLTRPFLRSTSDIPISIANDGRAILGPWQGDLGCERCRRRDDRV